MPRRHEPSKQFKVTLPVTVAAPLQELYFDPVLNRPAYGALSDLITHLLRQHLHTLGVLTIDDARRFREEATNQHE